MKARCNSKTAQQKGKAVRTLRPKPTPRTRIEEELIWQGIELSISYEANWLNMSKRLSPFATAHLEIRVLSPERAALPITDTGYRSEFIAREPVENAGGPIAYVKAWLDDAAKAPEWKRKDTQSRQFSLF